MTLSPQFIWNAAAIALGVIGGTLFLWAMFKDRPRGRLRCPKCWYDMKGAKDAAPEPPWTCPECGRTIRAHKHLRRTRRKLRVAVPCLLLLLLALYGWTARDRVIARGWIGAIPTTILMLAADTEALDDFPTIIRPVSFALRAPVSIEERFTKEFCERAVANGLWNWQRICFLRRAIRNDPSILDLLVLTRPTWVQGLPVYVRLQPPSYSINLFARESTVRVRLGTDGEWFSLHNPHFGQYLSVGTAHGEHMVLEIEIHDSDSRGSRRRNWKTTLPLAVTEQISEVIRPLDHPPDGHVGMGEALAFLRDNGTDVELCLPVMARHIGSTGSARDCARGVRVEVYRDEELMATGTAMLASTFGSGSTTSPDRPQSIELHWLQPPPRNMTLAREWSSESTDDTPLDIEQIAQYITSSPAEPHPHWSVVVTGDAAISLGAIKAEYYWPGTLRLPIAPFTSE
jgi:hypothetical protein